VANAGLCGRLLPNTEERHSGDTEQDNRHGANQPEENKMEERVHPDFRFLSSIGHCRIAITFGPAALGYPESLSCSQLNSFRGRQAAYRQPHVFSR
jgi:hypothetical protein